MLTRARRSFEDEAVRAARRACERALSEEFDSEAGALAGRGALAELRLLVRVHGLGADRLRSAGNFALLQAARGGHAAVVAFLLECGLGLADLLDDDEGHALSAFDAACVYGHLAVVDIACGLGLALEDLRADRCFAFESACAFGRLPVARALADGRRPPAVAPTKHAQNLRKVCRR